MMRKIRVGERYAFSRHKYKPKRLYRYISLLAVLTSMCLYARAQEDIEWTPAASGQSVPVAKGLQIGDSIPDELWNIPLCVVNHPEGKDTITLNEYRGQRILLDFLSIRCSGCIKALPNLKKVVVESSDEIAILPITPERSDQVSSFITKNAFTRNIGLPFVVEDVILKQHFPHRYISHLVWINKKGMVCATTNTSQLTARTIQEFRYGNLRDWPVKTESTAFFNDPLVTLNADANLLPNNIGRVFYYSSVTGYTEGVGPYVDTRWDTLQGTERISIKNKSIFDMYRLALDDSFDRSQIILEVDSPATYVYTKGIRNGYTMDEWLLKYGVCYEATFKRGTSEKAWKKQMILDLNRYLNLDGRIVEKDTTCLVLLRTDSLIDIGFKGGKLDRVSTLNSSLPNKTIRGFSLFSLVNKLKRAYPNTIIVDKTNYQGLVDLTLEVERIENLENLRAALKKYGLDLLIKPLKTKYFVLSEI